MPRQSKSEAVKSDRRSGYILSLLRRAEAWRRMWSSLWLKGDGGIRKITKPPILLLQFHKAIDFAPLIHSGQRHIYIYIASSYTYLLYFTLFFTYLISIKSKYIRRVFNGLSETIPLYDFSCSSVLNIKSKPFFL